jgi:hypothetical protein
VNVWAVANPEPEENHDKLTTRAAGFGIVKFNRTTREITMECWPRNIDITARKSKPYPGWPKTIHQEDNYGRAATAYLPTLKVKGQANPVVQVVDESNGEIVYTLRINGNTFRPKIFRNGIYTIHVGEGSTRKTLKGVQSIGLKKRQSIHVAF